MSRRRHGHGLRELYRFLDLATGSLDDDLGVYGLGNVLTGKGNIVASRKNAREVTGQLMHVVLAQGAPEQPQEVPELEEPAPAAEAERAGPAEQAMQNAAAQEQADQLGLF